MCDVRRVWQLIRVLYAIYYYAKYIDALLYTTNVSILVIIVYYSMICILMYPVLCTVCYPVRHISHNKNKNKMPNYCIQTLGVELAF